MLSQGTAAQASGAAQDQAGSPDEALWRRASA
jgi:hypothetical protein